MNRVSQRDSKNTNDEKKFIAPQEHSSIKRFKGMIIFEFCKLFFNVFSYFFTLIIMIKDILPYPIYHQIYQQKMQLIFANFVEF